MNAAPPARQRTILHIDLDAFFCAVEERLNPSLRGKAFAVGGQPDHRGVVASCSYAARQFGIHSAMPMMQAVRRCPDLIIVPSNFKAYSPASREVMARLNAVTPLVEQISIDEAFMDVTGHPQAGLPLAQALQATINRELELPCSLGVASNKLVAKIANNMGKSEAGRGDHAPNAIKVIKPGDEAAFLAPLPIRELWGVGPKTAERLQQMGIQTIGDVARRSEAELSRLFGKSGVDLWHHSRGIDDRPIETERESKSISRETTYDVDVADPAMLRQTLRELTDGVGWRLRRSGLCGNTVKIKLRWSDFTTLTRQVSFTQPIDQDNEIFEAALDLFNKTWIRGRHVRLIGVGVSGLEETRRQLGLFDAPAKQEDRRLQSTLDELRDRFGESIIKRGGDVRPEPDED